MMIQKCIDFFPTILRYSVAGTVLAMLAPLAQAQGQPPAGETFPAVPPMPVVAAPDVSDPGSIRVLLSPELETTLVSQMVGRVSELNAGLGTTVTEGQTIVAFDCSEAEARLRMARAENAGARETLGVKQRLHKLNAAGDIEVSLARSEAEKSAAAIAVSQAQLDQCTVTAPFNGRVVKVHVKPHQGVNVGAPLVELVSDGPLKIRLNVPSRLLKQLKVGTAITVDIIETGGSYPAHITAINARVDAVAQTIEVEAHLDDTIPELLPGMSGIARLPVSTD